MRKDLLPSPEDRTVNDPAVLVPSENVLAIYNANQGFKNKEAQNHITEAVRRHVAELAEKAGWSNVRFYGNSLFLEAKVRLA